MAAKSPTKSAYDGFKGGKDDLDDLADEMGADFGFGFAEDASDPNVKVPTYRTVLAQDPPVIEDGAGSAFPNTLPFLSVSCPSLLCCSPRWSS